MLPKLKNAIIFIVIAAVVGLGFFFFLRSRSGDNNNTGLVSTTPAGTPVESSSSGAINPGDKVSTQDFLALLLNVRNIKLDDSIFTTPAFLSLQDSSIILEPDSSPGRANPFAQFGHDAVIAPEVIPDTGGVPLPPGENTGNADSTATQNDSPNPEPGSNPTNPGTTP